MNKTLFLAVALTAGCGISQGQQTSPSTTTETIRIYIYNHTPDRYRHAYTKNENWNRFFSDSSTPKRSTLRDGQGSFAFSVDIDSLGLGTGYRDDVSADTFTIFRPGVSCSYSHRYDPDSIISLSDYGSQSGFLAINNLRGPALASTVRLYLNFPNSKKIKTAIPFVQQSTKESSDYNGGGFPGVSQWRGIAFSEDNHFTGDSLSEPRLSPALGNIRWSQDDTVTITKRRLLNGVLLVDGYFSEKLTSALARPYNGNLFEKTWYMKGWFNNVLWKAVLPRSIN